MLFKIKSVRVKISFSFFALILLMFSFENSSILLVSLISSLFHELIHVVFIFLFGGKISELSLSLLGGKIQRCQSLKLSSPKEAIISLSAPVANAVAGALLLLKGYEMGGYVNLVIGGFNLLPFYDFDGGRGLQYILTSSLSYEKSIYALNITSLASVALVSSLTATILFQGGASASLIILSVYMIILFFKNLSTENI